MADEVVLVNASSSAAVSPPPSSSSSFSPSLSFVRLHFLSFSYCIIIFICVFPKPLHVHVITLER